jgi:hypothetical protein
VTAEFEELVDLSGLTPEERSRLKRVHEMLVAAGPPPELPGELTRPPADVEAEVVPLESRRRRGRTPAIGILIAATVAVACFGGGYLLANQGQSSNAIHAVRVVPLSGVSTQPSSSASLRVGSADKSGNWPLQLTVAGLKPLPDESRYYLMVWQHGKPTVSCGTFGVSRGAPTTVTFNVAYKITPKTRWVVTMMSPGAKYPGPVVMTTS